MIRIDLSWDFDPKMVDLKRIEDTPIPAFATYKPEIKDILALAKRYKDYKELIVIGNGGSITSLYAFYKSLAEYSSKTKLFILTTMDPDLIWYLKERFSKDKTLVIPISKSGDTVGVLEELFAFDGYPTLSITTEGKGALWQITKKRGWDYATIPESIGGRFSGRTPAAYLPAAIIGIDIASIDEGISTMYERCHPKVPILDNPALRLASFLFLLDQNGYTEIFHPVYSPRLEGFIPLIVQLIHESSGKEGKGQTIYGSLAPESQHHTNQRFFGGRRNVCGLFLRIERPDKEIVTHVPEDLRDIELRYNRLMVLDGIPLSKALYFEYKGMEEDSLNNNIPHASITIDKITPFSVGEYLGLIHYLAFYSSLLRRVDPFNQPQVEEGKRISLALRKGFKDETHWH